MHRGTVFIITKNKDNKFEIQKSTEFNGGMGIENLGGAIYDMLKNILSAFLFFVNMSIFAVLNEKSDKRYGTYNATCQ